MTTRHWVSLSNGWLAVAVLTTSCGGLSSRSAENAGAAGSLAAGSGGGTVVVGEGGDNGSPIAGTGGVGGMAANAGAPSAGSAPNPEPCVQGEPCTVEGSECGDSSGCCVVIDTCIQGRWTETTYLGPCKNDPPAPPLICPAAPPKEGAACGVCVEECDYQTCTPDGGGSNLAVQCVAGKWAHFDNGCLECCQADSDCAEGSCVNTRCVVLQEGAGCYRDADCGAGRICSGAQVCHCGAPCKSADQTGQCVSDHLGCCGTDADCTNGQECVAGVCKPPPPVGSCWTNRDCTVYGFPCAGASVCPCGANCIAPDTIGQCPIPL